MQSNLAESAFNILFMGLHCACMRLCVCMNDYIQYILLSGGQLCYIIYYIPKNVGKVFTGTLKF